MGFFNTVTYSKSLEDNSWFAKAESLADACRAPSKWVAAEIWSGGKTYQVSDFNRSLNIRERNTPTSEGLLGKIARVVAGVILAVPGYLLSIPLMSSAYLSEEIRLKHAWSSRKLTDKEFDRLNELIDERKAVSKEQQGCEPISCMLVSIVCLMCCLVCAAE